MIQAELNILIQLAKIDGIIVKEEIDLIKKIGISLGLSYEEISACFNNPNFEENLDDLTTDEKIEFLFRIVELMKIDGRLYKEEIKFCAKITNKLGYDESVLLELMLNVKKDLNEKEKEELKKHIQTYLLH